MKMFYEFQCKKNIRNNYKTFNKIGITYYEPLVIKNHK